MATISTITPQVIKKKGCVPAFFHSPEMPPQTVAVITINDMNSGHARIVPHWPRVVVDAPYKIVLPNQANAINAAKSQ